MDMGPLTHLHPKEGDAGEKVHSGFEVLESLWTAGWKVILLEESSHGRRLGGMGKNVLGETQEPQSFRRYVRDH